MNRFILMGCPNATSCLSLHSYFGVHNPKIDDNTANKEVEGLNTKQNENK